MESYNTKVKHRESKNKKFNKFDTIDKPYSCGCKKNYLSYPALFTHIKNKHNSVNPPGTNYPMNKPGAVGRPKVKKYTL